MILKKIRIVGFKSFVDETEIELPKGMISIVGPNGCGKSNILDAVRWVLGERSARGLRGNLMEDVIFLGSEQRRAAGMAEVEILFDNRGRRLDLDQDEVVIGRRLYLSSISEYYLSGRRTTRREIDRLFMDTGIGKSAYSIMEQGRISEILNATPEVRRALIDEAAGISRFKVEREETLSKLQATEANILRLNDIMKAKRQQMDSLDQQAHKTRQYIALKKELQRHDRNLRYLSYLDLGQKAKNAESKLEALIKKRDDSIHRSRSLQDQIEEIDVEERKRLEQIHHKDRQLHQNLSTLEALQADRKRFQSERELFEQRERELRKRIAAEERHSRALEKRGSDTRQLRLDLDSDIDQFQLTAKSLSERVSELNAAIQDSIEEEQKIQQAIREGEKRHAELLESLKKAAGDLIMDLGHKKRELESQEEHRTQLKRGIIEQLERYEELLAAVKAHITTEQLQAEQLQGALLKLSGIQLKAVISDFQRYDATQQELRSLLFDKSSFLSRRELLDQEMDALIERREALNLRGQHLQARRRELRQQLDKGKSSIVEVDIKIRDREVRQESLSDISRDTEQQLAECRERLNYFKAELLSLQREWQDSRAEEKKGEDMIKSLSELTRRQSGEIDLLRRAASREIGARREIREKAEAARAELERLLPRISEHERQAEQIRSALSLLERNFYNDFQLRFGDIAEEYSHFPHSALHEERELKGLERKIEELGAFNALAIEELEQANREYGMLEEQRRDIDLARKNIFDIIAEIDQRSRLMFQETFSSIEANFAEIFQSLFGGGAASLALSEPENPLASGVDIMVQPPGKKNSSISLLSGGEQSLAAIALIFAIYLVRPAPFCFLDEVDAALDDSNVGRFLQMLSRFTPETQFIVITHNKLTMSFSQAIIGVTQEEAGVSKLISVRLEKLGAVEISA